MVVRLRIAVVAWMVLSASAVQSADSHGIKLNPGERIVAINGVPVEQLGIKSDGTPMDGKVTQASATVASPSAVVTEGAATNIVGNLVRSNMPFSHTPGETAIDKANHERRRNGMGALVPDPQLQELALQKAKIAAARGYKNHIGGSLGGARAEGVGHTQGRFLSCCLDMPATYGGAAMVQGADGWYCCLLVR